MGDRLATIICAADANYFDLLKGLVDSATAAPLASQIPLSILDLGLTPEQISWVEERGGTVVAPGWDIQFPGVETTPNFFKAMTARPHLRDYFPDFDTYLWIDSDAWVQDDSVLTYFMRAAERGQLAIVPELDRAYSSFYKRPKRYSKTQNHKAYRYAFGLRAADRLARNPILNSGVFGLAKDAPHWDLWKSALTGALNRRRLKRGTVSNLNFRIIEQTSLNYVVFADKAPTTFLPAYCNWFCGKGVPMFDDERRLFVEPNEPFTPIGILHLAGHNIQEKVFDLTTIAGRKISTRLTFDAASDLTAKNIG